jgi:hypothetical protein
MKKQILFIWYSQTGQLSNMVHSLASGFDKEHCEIDYCQYKFEKRFPFPWTKRYFFNQMPEGVLGIPFEIDEQPIVFKEKYDLIIFAYQPWFLHPSLPSMSIIKNDKIQKVLKNTPVITLIGARNMWLHAQEKIKEYLCEAQANLVGNIVLVDSAKNLASMFTVQRWMFKGKKDAYFIFPPAGINELEIQNLYRLTPLIEQNLQSTNFENLQSKLLDAKALQVKPQLIPLEQRGVTNFRKFAKWIYDGGDKNSENRYKREWVFSFLLPKVATLLSPITFISNKIKALINKDKLLKDKAYFESVLFISNKF